MPSPEIRAIAALVRYSFKHAALHHAVDRANEIADGDEEVAAVIASVASWVAATTPRQ